MVNRRLRRRPSIELTLGQDIVFNRTLWSAVEKKAKLKNIKTLLLNKCTITGIMYITYFRWYKGTILLTNLRLKQSARHKGGTIRNPELFELRVEHPPSEKKTNKIVKTFPK